MSREQSGQGMFVRISAALLAATALSVRLAYGPRTVDDAFISFRYARNIAEGAGFVFNQGERVLGTTTPLFTLLLSCCYRLGADLSLIAWWISCLFDLVTTLLIFWIILRYSGSSLAATLGAALFAVSSGSIIFAGGGMESSFFVMLLTLSMALFFARRHDWATVVAALAALTRPEGGLLLLLLGGVYMVQYRTIPWRMVGIALLIGLPWLVFATLYFGSPLPHAMLAKRYTYVFPPLTALRSLLGYLVDYTIPTAGIEPTRFFKYGCLVMLLFLAGAAEWARKKELHQHAFVILWLFPALYLALYAVANPPVWEWYALPMLAPVLVLLSSGLYVGVRSAVRAWGVSARILPGVFIGFLLIVASAGSMEIGQLLVTDLRIGRELSYAAIAQELSSQVSTGATVAAPEIGALGYYLPDVSILDTQGLVSPSAIPHQQQMREHGLVSGSVPLSLIIEEQPEFIVAPERLIRDSLLKSEWFFTHYQQIMKVDSNIWGSEGILAFARAQRSGAIK